MFFTWNVDRKGSQVGVCENRSKPSPTHLSLLCICCTWERASGKSPLFFLLPLLTPFFSPLLWRETEENPPRVRVCMRVCVYALAPPHLRSRNENPSLPGEPQTGRHARRLRSDSRRTWHGTLAHAFRHTWVAHLWAGTYTSMCRLKCRKASLTLVSNLFPFYCRFNGGGDSDLADSSLQHKL